MGDTIDYRNIMVAVDNSDYSNHGMIERVPSFVRNMARMSILRYEQDKGHTVISSSIVNEAMDP